MDLVVLDIGLPGMDGLEVCRRLRTEGSGVPVLVLTARTDEVDTVVGPGRGCRRLRDEAVPAGRAPRPGPGPAAPGRHRDRPGVHGVRIDVGVAPGLDRRAELALTAKEFDLLRVLLRENGKVVTREQLMREVWDTRWWGSTKTLDMHVSWLRKKLPATTPPTPASSPPSEVSGSASSASDP